MVFNAIAEPATLEALAFREALALVLDLSLDRIIIACDCKAVVTDIKKGTKGRYSAIIKEICVRARDFNSCDFIFECRSMNCDPHNLAKISSSFDEGRRVWMGLPHDPFVIPVTVPLAINKVWFTP